MDKTTEQVIYEMLTESTGTHFLDSGGASNRHWQQNQTRTLEDFKKDEYVVYNKKYDEITLNIFPFLNEFLEYNEEENEHFENYLKANGFYNNAESAFTYFDKALFNAFKIHRENTYNLDCILSQHFQIIYCNAYNVDTIALSIHNGADVRGGYTDFKIFDADTDGIFNFSYDSWSHIKEEFEDKPRPDEEYLLIGASDSPSIFNGNTWAESKIK